MKSIIPLLAITVLAMVALAGCDQNAPSDSTSAPSTNASITAGGDTNTPPVNSVPGVNTNAPASTNQQ